MPIRMKKYYSLVKPGIVYGNAMTALAAFVFAADRQVDVRLLLLMLVGLSFSIASACVLNNILDRDIDLYMERTKNRPLVTGEISVRHALLFAFSLGAIGLIALIYTGALALLFTLFGVVIYVGVYTPLKRVSRHSTIVGALAGAVPPVVGYVAVTREVDIIALALFLFMVCWQMVHFLAIAIFRKSDYASASLPVMPVHFSHSRTKILMIVYAFLFAYTAYVLFVVAHLGALYAYVLGLLSLGWMILASVGFRVADERWWARHMFFYSIVVLLLFSIVLSLS